MERDACSTVNVLSRGCGWAEVITVHHDTLGELPCPLSLCLIAPPKVITFADQPSWRSRHCSLSDANFVGISEPRFSLLSSYHSAPWVRRVLLWILIHTTGLWGCYCMLNCGQALHRALCLIWSTSIQRKASRTRVEAPTPCSTQPGDGSAGIGRLSPSA